MSPTGVPYSFQATVWRYAGPAGWHFVSVPAEQAAEIRSALQNEEEGWGRLRATARIGGTEWQTALWFDTKHNTYLLPLKAAVRQQEALATDQSVAVQIWV